MKYTANQAQEQPPAHLAQTLSHKDNTIQYWYVMEAIILHQ
jgi:hypothetical protein